MSGTKVTTDPESQNNPISEASGLVTSDSLAGESLKSGGDFGSTTGAAASDVPSHATTSNTTDVSGATQLDGAADREARQAKETWSETAQLNAGRELSGGNNAVTGSTGSDGTNASGAGTGGGAISSDLLAEQQKPKGANLTEGGFDGNEPNSSFGTDIGGKNDPGRDALQGLANSAQSASGATGSKQGGVSGDGLYDALKDASA